jgi:ubiquinone/menaquinone biosynthesis C-methylase UbiE
VKFKAEILVCPICNNRNEARGLERGDQHLTCESCGAHYPLENGIPNLVTDPRLRTKLEDIDYDKIHSIDKMRRQRTFDDWSGILNSLSIDSNKILEIGSGTGQLTWGLMHCSQFDEVYATDISGIFLNRIARDYELDAKNRTYYYICDANQLPFQSNSFDVVVGHSVLHHFLNYEQTLEAIFKILRPGGYAVFYEPIIQGKIFIAFFLNLIQKLDQSFQLDSLTEQEHKKISQMVKHLTKASFIKGDKGKLEKMEDKYIFDNKELGLLSADIGYSSFEFRSYKTLDPSYKSYLTHQWKIMGLEASKLGQFQDVFDAFGNTVGALLGGTISSPMGYLLFEK